jgi:hypothetical protein
LEHAINQFCHCPLLKARLVVAIDHSYGVHPSEGILQIYFDQMNVIAKHLQDNSNDGKETAAIRMNQAPSVLIQETVPPPPPDCPPLSIDEETAQVFTKKQFLTRDDWLEWEKAQFKQLDQYWNQGMFSKPMPLPQNANALHSMLLRFNRKVCGTRKSRMVLK